MDPENIIKLPYEELKEYTDNFSQENYIGEFQFGKIYRGKIDWDITGMQDVTVKIWEVPKIDDYCPGDNELRLADELVLLRHEKVIRHPGMLKVYGFSWEGEHLGVVYEFKSLDTLKNLLLKGKVFGPTESSSLYKDDIGWLNRIKVAIGFADLLKFLHCQSPPYDPFLVGNVDASHIMIDEEHYPKLFDISTVTGGIFSNMRANQLENIYRCNGSVDPPSGMIGRWTKQSDVYAFGVLLLSLITKRMLTEEDRKSDALFFYKWAWREYGSNKSEMENSESKRSLVSKSLEADPAYHSNDGIKITSLAMQCMECKPENRPTMKQVLKCLMKLQIVQSHADYLGVDNVLRAHNAEPGKEAS